MPVEPTLFELVKEYAEALSKKRVSADTPLKKTAPIIVFCQNFFLQFFENVLASPITSIGTHSKRVASSIAVKQKDTASAEVLALVEAFEDLCDAWPDVLALGYGGSVGAFRRFHESFVPRLLGRIVAWSETSGEAEVRAAALEAQARYTAAIEAA